MAEEKSLGKFVVYCGLILFLFLVMVIIISSFKGKTAGLEVGGLVFLMLLTLLGFGGYQKAWGERVLFFVFLFSLANLILIWWVIHKLFMLPLFLSLVGFLMGLPKKEEKEEGVELKEEPYSEVFEDEEKEGERKEKREVQYEPGKYVASKRGSVYHEPRCEWAEKIAEERRVWFKDKKEARKKHYKAHKCVK